MKQIRRDGGGNICRRRHWGLKMRLLAGEIDDDLTRFTGDIANFNAITIAIFQLRKQRQRIVVVAKMHGFAGTQGVKRAKNGSMAEALSDATGIERGNACRVWWNWRNCA